MGNKLPERIHHLELSNYRVEVNKKRSPEIRKQKRGTLTVMRCLGSSFCTVREREPERGGRRLGGWSVWSDCPSRAGPKRK
jgi:hypothetical protein